MNALRTDPGPGEPHGASSSGRRQRRESGPERPRRAPSRRTGVRTGLARAPRPHSGPRRASKSWLAGHCAAAGRAAAERTVRPTACHGWGRRRTRPCGRPLRRGTPASCLDRGQRIGSRPVRAWARDNGYGPPTADASPQRSSRRGKKPAPAEPRRPGPRPHRTGCLCRGGPHTGIRQEPTGIRAAAPPLSRSVRAGAGAWDLSGPTGPTGPLMSLLVPGRSERCRRGWGTRCRLRRPSGTGEREERSDDRRRGGFHRRP